MEQLDRKKFLKLLGLSSLGLISTGISASSLADLNIPNSPATLPPLRVAHLTDIHIQSGHDAEKGFASCLNAVNSLSHKADIIINGGDAIMNSALTFSKATIKNQWQLFHKMIADDNSLPVYHCIGNHDLYGWPMAKCSENESKLLAMDEYAIKNPYYSMIRDNWKFIVLDSIRCKNSIPGYYAELDEAQMIWLEDELKNTPENLFICIVSHVPILAICTLFDSFKKNKRNKAIPDNILHADTAELTSLFYKYPKIKACLSGHIHMIDHVNYLGIDYYCNGAVSGSWWKGSHHQFPPSFSIMNFYADGKVTREVEYYDWNQSIQISANN